MTAPAQFPPSVPYGYQHPQFTSQLPIEDATLAHALRSEWTKIRTVRSTVWTLCVMLALVIGINLLVVVPINDHNDGSVPVLGPGLFGLIFGQLAIITLGVLVITSEYGTGMIRTTLTSCPQRSRVLAAKAIVFFLLTFTITTVACTMTALINWSVLSGKSVDRYDDGYAEFTRNGHLAASGGQWLGATLGAALYVALLGLLALAVGTLLRHSAGAITAMLGVVMLPLMLAIFLPSSLQSVRDNMIRYSAPNALASLYRLPMIGDADQNGLPQLFTLLAVTAVALTGAFVALNSRDV
jgi:ABC-type transport system involved in multi-copper enzyme maturation permease subunit